MLASAEVDVVAKQLCDHIASNSTANGINEYRTIILSAYLSFPTSTVSIPRHGLALRPWSNWSDGENPTWWRAHNNVKHNRHMHFAEANLKNALNAVGALLLSDLVEAIMKRRCFQAMAHGNAAASTPRWPTTNSMLQAFPT